MFNDYYTEHRLQMIYNAHAFRIKQVVNFHTLTLLDKNSENGKTKEMN